MLDALLLLKIALMVAILLKDAKLLAVMVLNLLLMVVNQSPLDVQMVLFLMPPVVLNYALIDLSPIQQTDVQLLSCNAWIPIVQLELTVLAQDNVQATANLSMARVLKFVLMALQLLPQEIALLTVLMVNQFHQLDAFSLRLKDVQTTLFPPQLDVLNPLPTVNSVRMVPNPIRVDNALILLQKDLLEITKHAKMTPNQMQTANVLAINTKKNSI